MKILKSLAHDPLVDALFEIRFRPSIPSSGDLLPGLLYKELGEKYRQVQQLPAANIPKEVRDKEPNLKYQAYHRMASENEQLLIGDRVATLHCGISYPGWEKFKQEAFSLLEALKNTTLLAEIERFSFRYINLLESPPESQLTLLNARVEILGKSVSEKGFQFRMELLENGRNNIIQIRTNATATLTREKTTHKRSGLLLDIDTLKDTSSEEFWEKRDQLLEGSHDTLKAIFVNLLTNETIESLRPIWIEK